MSGSCNETFEASFRVRVEVGSPRCAGARSSASRSTASSRESSRRWSPSSSPGCPTSASEEMDRIEFTFWFTTVICIGVFAVVAAAIVYSVLKFRVQPEDDIGRAADPRPHRARDRLDGDSGRARDRDLDRQRDRARQERRRRPEPAPDRGDRAAVRVEVRVPGRRRRSPRASSCCRWTSRQADAALARRDPLRSGCPSSGRSRTPFPAIETTLVITPTRMGEYSVVCTELCGLGHATMRAPRSRSSSGPSTRSSSPTRRPAGGDENSGEAVFTTAGLRRLPRVRAGRHATPRSGRASTRSTRGGQPLEEFVRESIVDPNARDRRRVSARRDAEHLRQRRSPTSSSTRSCSIWSTDRRGAVTEVVHTHARASTRPRRRGAAAASDEARASSARRG